jgi:hypothetical protein
VDDVVTEDAAIPDKAAAAPPALTWELGFYYVAPTFWLGVSAVPNCRKPSWST